MLNKVISLEQDIRLKILDMVNKYLYETMSSDEWVKDMNKGLNELKEKENGTNNI